jgi:hypothetical protein
MLCNAHYSAESLRCVNAIDVDQSIEQHLLGEKYCAQDRESRGQA